MKKRMSWLAVPLLALLGGCATLPTGPSVMALPGTGKNLDEFHASDNQCRYYAAQIVGGAMNSDPGVKNAAVGTAVGAVAGAAIGGQQGAAVGAGAGLLAGSASGVESTRLYGYFAQRRYDESYIQCMYASGHKVPVPGWMAKSFVQKSATQNLDGVPGASVPPPPPNTAPTASPPPDYVSPVAR